MSRTRSSYKTYFSPKYNAPQAAGANTNTKTDESVNKKYLKIGAKQVPIQLQTTNL